MARKPQPTQLKIIKGNPGRRPLNKREPCPKVVLPEAPDWLDERAKQCWNYLAPMLARLRVLTEADLLAFEALCKTYSRWRQAEAMIEKSPTLLMKRKDGEVVLVPHVRVAQNYFLLLNKSLTDFGLNPSARSKIIAGGFKPQDDFDF